MPKFLISLALSWPALASASVVINEFLPNPLGADSGQEWVELYNNSQVDVDLSGWTLETATTSWRVRHTFAANTLLVAGAYLVVGDAGAPSIDVAADSTLSLGNASSSGDGLRLVNAGSVVDTVIYGPDDGGFLDDNAPGPAKWIAAPSDGQSLSRSPNGVDTNDSALDFVSGPPTQGQPNPSPLVCHPSTGVLVINELLPNPVGSDSTAKAEWVELYNRGAEPVALGGWRIQSAGSGDRFVDKVLFAEETVVPPLNTLLIGEPNAPQVQLIIDTLSLGSGAGGDGLRLLDCEDTVVDSVVYGASNDDEVIDESGQIATSFAPKPGEGQSVARVLDGVDTDRPADDFWVLDPPSPGAFNPPPPPCFLSDQVVINEFRPDPVGADSTVKLEFVELYNRGAEPLDLSGWSVQSAGSGDSFSTKIRLEEGELVPASGWFVVGESAVSEADKWVETLGFQSGSGGDALRLVDCEGGVVDTVAYGPSDNEDGVIDDSGQVATSLAPDPTSGEILARRFDGEDTDLSADDFYIVRVASIGQANPDPPVCEPSVGGLVINEFLPNPVGSDSEAQAEWIELYNAGSEALRLDGWRILGASSESNFSEKAVLPDELLLASGAFFVIGEPNADSDLSVPKLGLGSGAGGDALRLVDCEERVVDTVVYGSENDDQVVDDSEQPAESLAPKPSEGQSVARKVDGVDTDLSGLDFGMLAEPTPGGANPVIVCVPSVGDVVINEFVSDPGGSDSEAQAEWVEFYNRGESAVSLDGWELVFAGKSDDLALDFVFPSETTIEPGDWLVLGGENVGDADLVARLSIGNGTNGDAIRLSDCAGTLVDVVIYGAENADGHADESGVVSPSGAPKPGSDQSLARGVDGEDTDQSADWRVARIPTPGATNVLPDDVLAPIQPVGRGCGQGANAPSAGDAPSEGCSSASSGSFGGLELWALCALLLRRRR